MSGNRPDMGRLAWRNPPYGRFTLRSAHGVSRLFGRARNGRMYSDATLSLVPYTLEPSRHAVRVMARVYDVAVAQVVLNQPCVAPFHRQRMPAAMP
jgi:hypothetical protein